MGARAEPEQFSGQREAYLHDLFRSGRRSFSDHSRQQPKTFNVAETVPGVFEVSTKVTSNVPVIAEMSMYGDGK